MITDTATRGPASVAKGLILYIGGFALPDKNAAAHRVIGIAKGLRELGYTVVFLNSLKDSTSDETVECSYFGFQTIEYPRENDADYLFFAHTALKHIRRLKPALIIAYNYPAIALNQIRRYCKANRVKCIADVTEWYDSEGNIVFRAIKDWDTRYRMETVHKKLDGIIAISSYLGDYYKDAVRTAVIPPTVDISDEKWRPLEDRGDGITTFVYAGMPSATKEKLDVIVRAIERLSNELPVRLIVVGIDKAQFCAIYKWSGAISPNVEFRGKIPHNEALQIVKRADWCIILRERNRVVQAGFPTKLVESISCGTPVIANNFSNIGDYLNENNSLLIESYEQLNMAIRKACILHPHVNTELFDYHNFFAELRYVIKE